MGIRKKVTNNGYLPANWQTFLRCSENKTELFSKELTNNFHIILLVMTEGVHSNTSLELNDLIT